MSNIKFNFRIKYESEKAAEEMKKALSQLRSLPIREIRVAGTRGAEGGIGARGASRLEAAEELIKALTHEIGVAGTGGAEGGIGDGRAVGTGRAGREKAVEEMIKALNQPRSQPIREIRVAGTGGAEGGIGAGGASRLDAAIESTIGRFGSLFQWIGGAEGGIGDAGDAGDGGAVGGGAAVGDGAAVAAVAAGAAGRVLEAAIESTIDRFGSLFQWIEGKDLKN